MKQNVKIFLIALGIGMISAFVVCYKIEPTIISNALETKVTYFYVGSYNDITSANNKKSNYNNALIYSSANNKKSNYNNALIYSSDSIYSVIIGVYNKKESIELMESYFLDKGINFRKKEVKASQELIKAMRDYELLIATSDKNYYENLNKSLLKLFSEYINK